MSEAPSWGALSNDCPFPGVNLPLSPFLASLQALPSPKSAVHVYKCVHVYVCLNVCVYLFGFSPSTSSFPRGQCQNWQMFFHVEYF